MRCWEWPRAFGKTAIEGQQSLILDHFPKIKGVFPSGGGTPKPKTSFLFGVGEGGEGGVIHSPSLSSLSSLPALANSLKADEDRKSDHTTLVQVKEEEDEVVTHTPTTETNLRQGDLGIEVDSLSEIQACVAPAEIWLRDAVPRVRLPAGDEQRGLAHDAEVRHSGARSHGFARPVLLDPGELCDSCEQDTPLVERAHLECRAGQRFGMWKA